MSAQEWKIFSTKKTLIVSDGFGNENPEEVYVIQATTELGERREYMAVFYSLTEVNFFVGKMTPTFPNDTSNWKKILDKNTSL